MATNQSKDITTNQMTFDSVITQTHQIFVHLIAGLISRREALLLKLSQLREDYTAKETARRAAIEEIEKVQQHMQLLSLKVSLSIHQQASDA